ncbi:MAG TPA: hypothetical protein VGQ83_32775 [Polyangia bacterium]|jgi:hypothetical protein
MRTTLLSAALALACAATGCASSTAGLPAAHDGGPGGDTAPPECDEAATQPCYTGPAETRGVGTCQDGVATCTGGRWGACADAIAPEPGNCAALSCAGVANPGCDCVIGATRYCFDGAAAQAGVGVCRQGTQLCAEVAGASVPTWGACRNQQLPEAEECDGLDHDCNGVPNDRAGGCACTNGTTRGCYDGPAGTAGVGTCHAGTQECVDGAWTACAGQVAPEPSNCAALSCAGTPNPGCGCTVGDTQPCYTGPANTAGVGTCHGGTKTCVAGAGGAAFGDCVGERLPEAEQCDGKDHDCNGTLNDRAGGCACSAGDTQPCYTGPTGTAGTGTCHAGTQACTLTGGTYAWGACQGEVAPVANDCAHASCVGAGTPNPGCDCVNGASRGCYTGPAATAGVGACHGGTQTCTAGAWDACTGQVLPATADACVASGAAYAAASDLTCSGTLDRHNPVATPTASAPTAAPLLPLPAGMVDAITARPLDTVTLTGAATDADGATTFSYHWRLVSAPAGNSAGLSGAPGSTPADVSTQQHPTFFAQLAGDYVVGVIARDASGCDSAEVKVLVRVKPHASIHLELTWDRSVDIDLQLVEGATAPLFGTVSGDTCYWNDKVPAWIPVKPSLDIDDVAGCNPENINFGSIGGTQPPRDTYYSVYAHYYCNRRGHRASLTDPEAVCYEPTAVTAAVGVTLKVFVDGVPAKKDGTAQDAVFTRSLTVSQYWKPVVLHYDASGVWRVVTATDPLGSSPGGTCTGQGLCVCGSIDNYLGDPYCGTAGAGCRQRYP